MEEGFSIYSSFIGRTVRVRICDSSEFKGTSVAIDAYLNVSLESALYYKDDGNEPEYYPSLFIKGSYIDHIALDT